MGIFWSTKCWFVWLILYYIYHSGYSTKLAFLGSPVLTSLLRQRLTSSSHLGQRVRGNWKASINYHGDTPTAEVARHERRVAKDTDSGGGQARTPRRQGYRQRRWPGTNTTSPRIPTAEVARHERHVAKDTDSGGGQARTPGRQWYRQRRWQGTNAMPPRRPRWGCNKPRRHPRSIDDCRQR